VRLRGTNRLWLPIAFCGVVAACHGDQPERSSRDLARPLVTGFEGQRSAPLGPGGELVARNAAEWENGWRALGLPGGPPAVDFPREIAVLRAQYFGGSPIEYESGVDSAVRVAEDSAIAVYAHARTSNGGVDTSSRKVLAAAIRLPSGNPTFTVQWRLTR
jgi:hypothetical protein